MVSTNVLPLMEFISADSNHAQVRALVEQVQGLPFSAFVGFFFAYEDLDLLS